MVALKKLFKAVHIFGTNQCYFWSCTYELPDIIDGMSYWILLNNKSRMEESSEAIKKRSQKTIKEEV